MTRGSETQGQLEFEQPKKLDSSVKQGGGHTGVVVGFVDASTLAIREAAIERVRASGIFSLPSGLKRR